MSPNNVVHRTAKRIGDRSSAFITLGAMLFFSAIVSVGLGAPFSVAKLAMTAGGVILAITGIAELYLIFSLPDASTESEANEGRE